MDIKGKTALITGGARRVGRGITLALAKAGANVVINYHASNDSEAQSTAMDAAVYGVETLTVQASVADPQQVKKMVELAEQRFGKVDILVNNASMFKKTPLPTTDFDTWHEVTGILIDGPLYCANAVAPGMLKRGDGAIVNIIDLSAWEPWPGYAAHSVGKSALLGLTRQLALDFAPTIRVNAVAPGPAIPPPHYDAAQIERTAHKTLLNRWGSADDVAQAVVFLVQADYITGEFICVDGGERFGHRKKEEG